MKIQHETQIVTMDTINDKTKISNSNISRDTPMKANERQLIKDIWNKHIDVQDQLLKIRSLPIAVLPNSAKIEGDRLHINVDERFNTNIILSKIADTYQISLCDIDLSKKCFFVNKNNSTNADKDKKKSLEDEAKRTHIQISSYPIINGIITQKNSSLTELLQDKNYNYSFDKKGRLQISISDIEQTASDLKDDSIELPPTASVVFRYSPTPLYFLEKIMPNIPWQHKTEFSLPQSNDKIKACCKIVTDNGYLPKELLDILNNQIGLYLYQYTYTFTVDKKVLSRYNPNTSGLPHVNEDGCSFSFETRILDTPDVLSNGYEEQYDFNLKYTRLKKIFSKLFGAENVSFKSQFEYRYNIKKFNDEFLSQQKDFHDSILLKLSHALQEQGYSISNNNELGVDFDWKNEQFIDVLTRVSTLCSYINLSYFENHKCNINLNYHNETLLEIENQIRDTFPSIHITNDHKNGRLYFYQEYSDNTKYNQIKRSLVDELNKLDQYKYSYELFLTPETKDKYYISLDTESLQNNLTDSVNDLKGSEFYFEDIAIGKLIKVNYPNIVFDISSSEKEKILQFVENGLIDEIKPNLTGEFEKMARLKKSFNAISFGRNLQNPNLSEFIFDASKAKPKQDIDALISPLGNNYLDINNNLLNNKVNEPQKQAIIKTLLAEDLAIIQGPPGTGKSTAIAEIMWQHIRIGFRDKKPQRILLTSETNLAVDNAIAKVVNSTHNIVKPIRIGGEEKLEMEGKQFNIDTLKIWVENGSTIYREENDDIEEDEINNEEKISQKIILENWLSNISQRIDKNRLSKNSYETWMNLLNNPTKEIRQIVYNKYIHNCNVIGATCSSIGEKNTKGNATSFFRTYCELFGTIKNETNENGKNFTKYTGNIKFDTIIQDESSKATPAELSLPLIYGKKNIIIGDHRQLPPLLDKEEFLSSLKYLLNKTDDKKQITEIKQLQKFVQKKFNEMEISHFQRLFESIDDSLKGVFNTQYRMHPAINEVIKQFYVEDGGLFCGLDDSCVEIPNVSNPQSRYHGLNIDGFISPSDHVIWIDTKTPEMLVGTSRVNYGEVEAIHKVLSKLSKSDSFKHYQSLWENDEDKQIGLISFYGKQLKLLKELRSEFRDIPIRISTVDRFQGMERNIIIVSMVRSNCIASDKNQEADFLLYPERGFAVQNDFGFAQSPNRLNVALSRAKRLLVIVGNSDLFRKKDIYDNVYKCIENSVNGKIIKADEL